MKALIKEILSSLFRIFRFVHRNRLLVLAYHEVRDAAAFEAQLKFLQRHYRFVSHEEVATYIDNGRPLPKYSLLVTFDDGSPTVFTIGMPLLAKYRVPAIAFVISENISAKQKFWWKIVEDFYTMIKGAGYAEARAEVSRMKQVPNKDRLSRLKEITDAHPSLGLDESSLDMNALLGMDSNGVVIGSHTAFHPILNQCEPAELEREFAVSKNFFEQNGLRHFDFFAYPNGDYSPEVVPVLKKYGVRFAFAFDHRINKSKIDRYAISRIRANAHDPVYEMKLRVSGISTMFQL